MSTSSIKSPTTPKPGALDLAAGLDPIAHRIYRALAHRGVDLAPAGRLAHALRVSEPMLRAVDVTVPKLVSAPDDADPAALGSSAV